MARSVSVARARAEMAEMLDRVAAGEVVELTRRGEAVAVLVPIETWQQLTGTSSSFGTAYAAWRATVDARDLEGLSAEWSDALRDRSPGRKVDV